MEIKTLIQTAIDALPNSYVPYSRFHVAAALLCKDGTVYTGNNIENASYTPTVCAERCAFFKAVGDGKREFEAIVICGGLHGVITDYCPPDDFKIYLAKSPENYREFTLEQILPMGFGPENLEVK